MYRFKILFILIVILTGCSSSESKYKSEASMKAECCKDSLKVECESAEKSEITCPKCGFKKLETMPTDQCMIFYSCTKCGEEMKPAKGDCCVFCTHGTHKCPSKQ